jgi:hypothetical protein
LRPLLAAYQGINKEDKNDWADGAVLESLRKLQIVQKASNDEWIRWEHYRKPN